MRAIMAFLRSRPKPQDFRWLAQQHHKQEHKMAKAKGTSIYRAMHGLRHGGLHRALGVPESETIPKDKIEAATHSKNEHVMHMANMAKTMAGFKK
jgi:hypothetical protein